MASAERTKADENRLLHIAFEDFDDTRLAQVRKIIGECGLPLSQIRTISLRKGFIEQDGERPPTIARYDAQTGVLAISTEAFVPTGRLIRALVHETAHSYTPLKISRNKDSVIAIPGEEKTTEFVRAVALQASETKIFINNEHAYVHTQYTSGKLSFYDFVEETWAILVDQRYTDPDHLRQVDDAQRKAMNAQGKKDTAVSLLSPLGAKKATGIDAIVIEKIGLSSKNPAALERHIVDFRSAVTAKGS